MVFYSYLPRGKHVFEKQLKINKNTIRHLWRKKLKISSLAMRQKHEKNVWTMRDFAEQLNLCNSVYQAIDIWIFISSLFLNDFYGWRRKNSSLEVFCHHLLLCTTLSWKVIRQKRQVLWLCFLFSIISRWKLGLGAKKRECKGYTERLTTRFNSSKWYFNFFCAGK